MFAEAPWDFLSMSIITNILIIIIMYYSFTLWE